MILVKCNRPGCEKTAEMKAAAMTLFIPAGWHYHADGEGRASFACSDDCFDIWWEQRRWKLGRRVMGELKLPEEKLLP